MGEWVSNSRAAWARGRPAGSGDAPPHPHNPPTCEASGASQGLVGEPVCDARPVLTGEPARDPGRELGRERGGPLLPARPRPTCCPFSWGSVEGKGFTLEQQSSQLGPVFPPARAA